MPNKPDAGFLRDPSGALVVSGLGTTAVLQANLAAISAQTTLQDITGLGLAIGASATEIWLVKYWLRVQAANPTMDVKFGFGAMPSGAAMNWGTEASGTSVAAWGSVPAVSVPIPARTATDTDAYGTASGTIPINIVAIVFGGGTAGTVQIQYAQNTSDAGNLQILRGSLMEAIKVAS